MKFLTGELFLFWKNLKRVILEILFGRFVWKGGGEVKQVGFEEILVVSCGFKADSSIGFSVMLGR